MDLAHEIVARLLNEEHFDVHQRTDLYPPTGKVDAKGRKVVRACSHCEAQFGADKQYPPDVWLNHGTCRRHGIQQYMQYLRYSREQAEAKVGTDAPPDWQEAMGDSPAVAAAPKATFWASSGSGGV